MVDSRQAELDEETRVEASQAYNILVSLQEDGKITSEKAELFKQKFYVLHEACIKNMQNERKLSEKISQLKKVRKEALFSSCNLTFVVVNHRLCRQRHSSSRKLSSRSRIMSTS